MKSSLNSRDQDRDLIEIQDQDPRLEKISRSRLGEFDRDRYFESKSF